MLEMINTVFPALPRWSVLLGGDQIESLVTGAVGGS